jgi:hypothetical protein
MVINARMAVMSVLFAVIGGALLDTRSIASQSSPPAAPSLQGAWQQDGRSAMMIATATWVAFVGVEGLPAAASYTVDGGGVTLQPVEAPKSFEDQILENDLGITAPKENTAIVLERFEPRGATLSFVSPGGVTLTWRRLE